MPTLKRTTSHVKPQFTPYDGDNPRPGNYRGILKQLRISKTNNDNPMFLIVVELAAAEGSSKKQYDGYPAIGNIVLGESDIQVEREQGLYTAICGKPDATVQIAAGFEKFKPGDRQRAEVEKIGGVKPQGKYVLVRLVDSRDPNYPGLSMEGVFPTRQGGTAEGSASATDEEVEEDIEVGVEADGEEVEDYTKEELQGKSLAALRKILVDEFEKDAAEAAKLKQKAALIEEILASQAADADEDEDEEDPEEEEEELDEDEEDEEDEEEEDDPIAELREELKGLDRSQLKVRLRKAKGGADVKVTVKMTDDDLREKIIQLDGVPF